MSRKNVHKKVNKTSNLFGLNFLNTENGSLFLKFVKPMPLSQYST